MGPRTLRTGREPGAVRPRRHRHRPLRRRHLPGDRPHHGRTPGPDPGRAPPRRPPHPAHPHREHPPRRRLHPDSTVLVTGATGALGRTVSRHLVTAHGVTRLVLVGRRGAEAPGPWSCGTNWPLSARR
nr:KR domain-containing protein [Streptomyces sp. Tu 6176]